ASAAEKDPKLAQFIEECRRRGTAQAEIDTAEKIGFDTGIKAIHPFDNNWTLPVYVANFILMEYGTGAIFGCPAHDQRDLDFARKYNLEVKPVVLPPEEDPHNFRVAKDAYTGAGKLYQSDFLDGLESDAAKISAIKKIEELGAGQGV